MSNHNARSPIDSANPKPPQPGHQPASSPDHHPAAGHHHHHSNHPGGHEHPNYQSFYSYRSEVRRVLSITLVLNVAVVILKLVVGSWTGSLSLLADALHSITD
ncbi:MAG: cation transporter, partial [Phormidesmis sp.]